MNVLRTHPTVAYRDCICENPYYVPPDEFLNPHGSGRELQRMLDRLHEDTANKERLQQSEERIRQASEQYKEETRALIDAIPQQIWSGPAVMDVTDRRRAEEQLRRLSSRLLHLHDEERRSIARDLHDSTGQDLVALATMLGQLRSSVPSRKSRKLLSECKELAERCIREVRTLSYVLHPSVLDQAGLVGAIRDYMQGFRKRSGIHVGLELSSDIGRMPRDVELALFRVVQESLTNIQRHSGSQNAKIRMARGNDLVVEISDSGRGVSGNLSERASGPAFQFGVGIQSMQERLKLIGGRLEIDSTISGTTVRVTIPLGDRREKPSHSTG